MKPESSHLSRALTDAFYRIFTVVARMALKRGVPYDAVADLAKRAFIDVARKEFTLPGRKQSASRVSVLTGIHRKDVARMTTPRQLDEATSRGVTSAAAVVAGWRRDKRFHAHSKPVALPFDEHSPSFLELVRSYGRGDVTARAVLDELLRVGAVRRQRDGRIRLLADAYIPVMTSTEALEILGSDVADLLSTIDHNISCEPETGFFQRRVVYDNIPAGAVESIHARVRRDGQAILEKLDAAIARHDRDSNPKATGPGRKRVIVGLFYHESDVPEDS